LQRVSIGEYGQEFLDAVDMSSQFLRRAAQLHPLESQDAVTIKNFPIFLVVDRQSAEFGDERFSALLEARVESIEPLGQFGRGLLGLLDLMLAAPFVPALLDLCQL